MLRTVLVMAHRWAGLVIALVLIIAGLTGAVLPYEHDLNRLMAYGDWHVAPPRPGAPLLSGPELKRRVEAETGGVVRYIRLDMEPDWAQAVFVGTKKGAPKLDYGEVLADPYTGEIKRRLRFGDLADGPVNLMPFFVKFHYSLGVGPWGTLAFGIASLVWVMEVLAGLWLTLPRKGGGAQWLRRWLPSWRIRTGEGAVAFLYDLHRAVGLWLLPAMLVFAWSGVAFNLSAVHTPVQKAFGAQGLYAPQNNPTPAKGEVLSDETARAHGAALMQAEAARRGFVVREPYALSWNPKDHAIGYYARTSLDGPTDQGSTVVWFDAVSGRLLEFKSPYGATAADGFDKATRMIHVAGLFGWPFKIFVSLVGVLTAVTAGAGAWLWMRRKLPGGPVEVAA